jgi:peptide/nickel transport system substrate-binding protein
MFARRNIVRSAMAITALAIMLVSTSCSGKSSKTTQEKTNNSSSSAKPKVGGTITLAYLADGKSLDPTGAVGTGPISGAVNWRYAIYGALVVSDTDGHDRYQIAQSMDSTDGVHWTIKLRPNVQFSDGTPLDAAALTYDWNYYAANPTLAVAGASSLASVTVADPTTVQVVLKQANYLFPQLLEGSPLAYVFSPTYEKAHGYDALDTHPVGAGPYMVSNWVTGSQLTMVRNPHYYGTAYADNLVIKFVSDPQQAYNALVTGQVNVVWSADPVQAATAKSAGYGVATTTPSGGGNIDFNTNVAPFNKLAARQAIAYAIDSNALNQSLFDGRAQVASTIFAPGSPYYDPSIKQISYDHAKAQALFDQLSAANGGKPFTFTIEATGSTAYYGMMAQLIQAQMTQYHNVDCHISLLSSLDGISAQKAGNYQMATSAAPRFVSAYPTLQAYLGTGGFFHYSNPALDNGLSSALANPDPAARKQAMIDLQKVIVQDVPILFTLRVQNYNIYNAATVGGVPLVSDGLMDFANVWLK